MESKPHFLDYHEQVSPEIIHEMKTIAEGYVNFVNLCEKSKT